MKLYAVRKGRKPGIYKTWAEAEAQVKGYSGAIFRSFSNKEDAQAFLDDVQKPAEDVDYAAKIFTDGGTRNHGNYRGGHVLATDKAAWAYLIQYQGQEISDSGGEFGATNNQMEQQALIEVLKKLIELNLNHENLLFTLDSHYVMDPIVSKRLNEWQSLGWRRPGGELKNADRWQQIAKLLSNFDHADFAWTHGHQGNYGNEFVDTKLNHYMDKM